MRQDHPGKAEEVICMDTEEARDTLDEYLKDHPEQRGKPRVSVPANFRPDHWPKPRVFIINFSSYIDQLTSVLYLLFFSNRVWLYRI